VPIIEVRLPGGTRTTAVIEPGALRRLPELAAGVGLTGTAGLLCDARLLLLYEDELRSLRSQFGEPISRHVTEVPQDPRRGRRHVRGPLGARRGAGRVMSSPSAGAC